MANRIAVAKFIEAGIATGRSPIACLQLLTTDELEVVLGDFLRFNGTQYVVRMNMAEDCWARDNNKIECIKRVRAITDCSLLESKRFVEGTGELGVNATQKDELRRVFGQAMLVK